MTKKEWLIFLELKIKEFWAPVALITYFFIVNKIVNYFVIRSHECGDYVPCEGDAQIFHYYEFSGSEISFLTFLVTNGIAGAMIVVGIPGIIIASYSAVKFLKEKPLMALNLPIAVIFIFYSFDKAYDIIKPSYLHGDDIVFAMFTVFFLIVGYGVFFLISWGISAFIKSNIKKAKRIAKIRERKPNFKIKW